MYFIIAFIVIINLLFLVVVFLINIEFNFYSKHIYFLIFSVASLCTLRIMEQKWLRLS